MFQSLSSDAGVKGNMLELIYASAACRPFDEGQLSDLLRQARANNARLGVTGILLYDQGSFLQVLEGDEHHVEPLFASIARDPRHDRVNIIRKSSVSTPSFAAWTMGFVSLDASLLKRAPLRHALRSNGSLTHNATELTDLLDQFREGRFRQYVQG